jgi:hypothetical protein
MSKNPTNGKIFYMDGNTTVCLLMKDGVAVARGIGIFSRLDTNFVPAIGRKYALDRAHEAEGRKENCRPILIDAERNADYDWFDSSLARDRFGVYKGYYMPDLTGTETLLLANHGRLVKKQ